MKVNERVIWLSYEPDGTISQTGFGTIVEFKSHNTVVILCDGGAVCEFLRKDVAVYEDWDE